jgi:RNA polymerase sigma factor (sigma-70 family)
MRRRIAARAGDFSGRWDRKDAQGELFPDKLNRRACQMSTAPLAAALTHLRKEAARRDPESSDRQLLHDYVAANDPTAFACLVRRHGAMVLGVCRRVLRHEQDAEDAFQAAFLVLARGARTIRKPDALTSWLHGVSYRIAMKAKRDAARRRKHEEQAEPRANAPAWEVAWRELQGVLDEEVGQLPPGYRDAFLLCCLEGLSKPQAAARLGVKENTVSSRLARARKRLQQRLAGRGISLASVLAALAVSGTARASVAPRLAHTVIAAGRLGAWPPVPGLSAKAISLAEGVIPTMLPNNSMASKVKRKKLSAEAEVSLLSRDSGNKGYRAGCLRRSGITKRCQPPGCTQQLLGVKIAWPFAPAG